MANNVPTCGIAPWTLKDLHNILRTLAIPPHPHSLKKANENINENEIMIGIALNPLSSFILSKSAENNYSPQITCEDLHKDHAGTTCYDDALGTADPPRHTKYSGYLEMYYVIKYQYPKSTNAIM